MTYPDILRRSTLCQTIHPHPDSLWRRPTHHTYTIIPCPSTPFIMSLLLVLLIIIPPRALPPSFMPPHTAIPASTSTPRPGTIRKQLFRLVLPAPARLRMRIKRRLHSAAYEPVCQLHPLPTPPYWADTAGAVQPTFVPCTCSCTAYTAS